VPSVGHVKYTQRGEKESDKEMKTKMTALFATLMIALMVAGFAYAHWSKVVTITGTVTTGKLHLTPSFHVDGIEGTEGWLPEPEGKHVSYINWTIEGNTLTITINNTHPCLTIAGYIDIHNDGTIPAGLKHIEWDSTPYLRTEEPEPDIIELYDDTVNETYPIAIVGVGGNYTTFQIDPCETVYLYFKLHFEEALPQGSTYTFTGKFEYWNWNEA